MRVCWTYRSRPVRRASRLTLPFVAKDMIPATRAITTRAAAMVIRTSAGALTWSFSMAM